MIICVLDLADLISSKLRSRDFKKKMAEEHRCQAPEGHILCVNNCGFFGSPATMNLCSKCYGDFRLKEPQEASSIKSSLFFVFVNRRRIRFSGSSFDSTWSQRRISGSGGRDCSGGWTAAASTTQSVHGLQEAGRIDRIQVQVRDYVLRVPQVPRKSRMYFRFQEGWERGDRTRQSPCQSREAREDLRRRWKTIGSFDFRWEKMEIVKLVKITTRVSVVVPIMKRNQLDWIKIFSSYKNVFS